MFIFSFVYNKVSSKPDMSFVTFSGFRYICIVYNNPSVASSIILMIYCCRFLTFMLINYKKLFFKLVPKKRFFVSIPVFEYLKNDQNPGIRDPGIVSPTMDGTCSVKLISLDY
jgi:hypothetical protein